MKNYSIYLAIILIAGTGIILAMKLIDLLKLQYFPGYSIVFILVRYIVKNEMEKRKRRGSNKYKSMF